MKIIYERDLSWFRPRGEANVTFEHLSPREMDELQMYLEEMYPQGITDGALNDLLWHGKEEVATVLGYKSADHMMGYAEDDEDE